MKIIIQLTLLLFCTLLYSTCTTEYTPDNLPTEQLHFGRTGGFTGAAVNYILVDNGQLFKEERDSISELGQIPAPDAEALLQRARDLDWAKAQTPEPGNMNMTLSYQTPAGILHELNWSRPDMPNLEDFVALHQDLLTAYQAQAVVEEKEPAESQEQ